LYFWFDTRINLTFISLAYWEQVAHNDNQHGLYHTEKTYNIVIKAGEGARQQGRRVGDHPQDSAIHWTGPNISIDRILNCTEKTNGQLCKAVIKQERWVEHIQRRAEHTAETYNRSQNGNCPKLTSMGKTLPDQERVS